MNQNNNWTKNSDKIYDFSSFEDDLNWEPGQLMSLLETEMMTLGYVFNNKPDCEKVFDQLTANNFIDGFNKSLFNCFLKIYKQGQKIDINSVEAYYLPDRHKWDDDPIIKIRKTYLTETFEPIENLIQLLKVYTVQRELKNLLQNSIYFINSINTTNIKEKLFEVEKKILDITSSVKFETIKEVKTIINECKMRIEQIQKGINYPGLLPTFFKNVDEIITGITPGELIILAARPGIGKTTFAINLVSKIGKFLINQNKPSEKAKQYGLFFEEEEDKKPDGSILFFSLEMTSQQIIEKLITLSCEPFSHGINNLSFDYKKIKEWSDKQNILFQKGIENISNLPLYIWDKPDLTLYEIQSEIREYVKNKNLKLVIIDYLQLLRLQNISYGLTRLQEVSEISRTLKILAKQFNIPIVTLAQLSRKIEERKGDNKKPILSDLRESGSIEQDADLVCFLSKNLEDDKVVDFWVAKNRNGATGKTMLSFNKKWSLFDDYFQWAA